jgi:hypothetical protein
MKICPCLAVIAVLAADIGATRAQTLPSYMAPIAGKTAATPSDIASKDVLALNTSMFELYGDAAKIFQKNILSKHPVILALFSGAGGRMILYRPGMAPIDAPQVPVVYQLLKSEDQSTMELSKVVCRYVDNPDDKSWRGSMLCFSQPHAIGARWPGCHSDGAGLARHIGPSCRTTSPSWMIAQPKVSSRSPARGLRQKQAPYLAKNVAWAAQTASRTG